MVTAEGEIVTASEEENPDLFWGSAAAAATSASSPRSSTGFTPSARSSSRDRSSTSSRTRRRSCASTASSSPRRPDELTTIFDLSVAPPLPFLPEEVHGKPIVMVGACYAGLRTRAAEVVRPLKEFGRPIVDLLEPKPYTALQSMFDPFVPHGWHRYWKSVELPPLTDAAIDTLVEHASAPTSPKSYCIVFQLGGALARVGEDETAFSQRDAAHNVNINAVWTEDDPEARRHIAWARDFFSAMQPHAGDACT